MAWAQDWHKLSADQALVDRQVRIGKEDSGTLVAQHAAAWTLGAQKKALAHVRHEVLAHPTQHLHTGTLEGVHNTLMVLRFLHDFEARLDSMDQPEWPSKSEDTGKAAPPEPQASVPQVAEDGDGGASWLGLEFFCRPWVVKGSRRGQELLRLEEFIPAHLRAMCAVISPCGLPLGSLLAWLNLQDPVAFCKLHLRRIAGPRVAPCRVALDSSYRVEGGHLSIAALKDAALSGQGAHELVQGAIPEFAGRVAAL